MDSKDTIGRHGATLGRCANCSAPLASDQRYCVSCGTRRGPLPASIDSRLRELRAVPPSTAVGAAAPGKDEPLSRWSLPTARVASLVVMAMLSFGVIAGSLATPGGAASLAHTLVIAVMPPPAPAVTSVTSDGGGGGSGGGSPAAITETITETAPSSPAASSSAGASSGSTSTAGAGASSGAGSGSAAVSLPPIKHVFIIMLSGQGYNESFGMTTGHPYLSSTLRKAGELLNNYYGVARSSLASEVALISGQGPTVDTEADCPVFTDVASTSNRAGSQMLGNGCVYPQTTPTLADELTDNGNTWRAYIQGIDQGPAGQPKSCRYPGAGAADPNQAASPTDPYVTWRNPFVYFQSLTTGTECAQDDVGLDDLGKDLKQVKTTPNFSYIAPDTCDDGSDTPCMPGATDGLARSDAFLKTIVPEIEASPAYKQDGMIVITFDQAPQSGPDVDTTSCCDQPTFPNLSGETGTTTAGASTTTGTTTGTTTTGTTTTGTTTTGTTTTDTSVTAPGTTTTAATTSAAAPPTTDTSTSAGTDTTTSTGTSTSTTTGTSTSTTTGITTTTPTTCPTSGTTTTGITTTGTTTTGTTTTSGSGTPTSGCTNADGTPLGGGQVGALLISRYIKPGSEDATGTFNHFSLLKTIEGLFSVKQLGYSRDTSLPEFDASVFNAYSGS